ncbi:MAG: S8 family serine peptidase, partial [Bdellovibrionaceae bacterium]|nr:S8 family serine peptidase [Pseudobdellovibrionaceae bacterium]
MKAFVLMISLLLMSFIAEGAPYVVYRPAKTWSGEDTSPLRKAMLTEGQAIQLRAQGFIVEPDQPIYLLQLRETRFSHRFFESGGGGGSDVEPPVWPLAAVRAQEANALPGGKGEGVSICLVDSGVDHRHPALAGALQDGRNFVDSRTQGDLMDASGHGTAMATLMAGRAVGGHAIGVAPAAKVSVAKVVAANGQGTLSA